MIVKVAKKAGFCFGVKRAMQMAFDEVKKSDDIYSLGPLIHNKQAVERFEKDGLLTVDSIDEIEDNKKVIIRSHGVSKNIYDLANSKNLKIIDTTCPFVTKIHEIVKNFKGKNYEIIVLGDKNHPEVVGINGWADNECIIIKNLEEAKNLSIDNSKKYCVVSQTTINIDTYEKIKEILQSKISNIVFNNTVCSATKERQDASKELSNEVDVVVVVGGKHSSNTQKLAQICSENVKTFCIETKDELDKEELKKYKVVGVTAGASTPDWIIEEVISFLESI